MFKDRLFWQSFAAFLVINLFLYVFIAWANPVLNFSLENYHNDAHHFLEDPRALAGNFDFLRSLGVYDGQWYLRIAGDGYPKDLRGTDESGNKLMGAMTYAFFPLYPSLIVILDTLFNNLELSAFILANLLMTANFVSLYFVISKLYSSSVARRAIFLMFLYPFSIFYRSYFTEALFLFLAIWFGYFLHSRAWIRSAAILALLCITRPNGIFLGIIFAVLILRDFLNHKVTLPIILICGVISLLPFFGWWYFNYLQTGDPLYWYHVQSIWVQTNSILDPVYTNLKLILSFGQLPFHNFHLSKIDVISVVVGLTLIVMSRKFLDSRLWLISLILWLAPLLTKDMMSFSRYQIVSYPLFIYLAHILKGEKYYAVLTIFGIALLVTSLFFVNWYWVG